MKQLAGRVIRGEGFGKTLGFPTANIDRRQYVREKLKIKLGVWAGRVELKISAKSPKGHLGGFAYGGKNFKLKIYPAAVVIGPVDKTGLPKIEAHIIGFKGNIYGKKIGIYLGIYLRPFKKFKTREDLIRQINIDINKVKKINYQYGQ